MPFTIPPTPPNRNNPATFSDDADEFLGWFPTFVEDYNDDVGLLGKFYLGVANGTANALTFSPGVYAAGLNYGTIIRFQPAFNNTGAATLRVDGLAASPMTTEIGSALPAGYLKAGVFHEAVWYGTGWCVNRPIERGSNANGDYVRFADGTQICTHLLACTAANVASGALWISEQEDWTFPVAFSTTNGLTVTGSINAPMRWMNCSGTNTTVGSFRQWAAASNTGTPTARVQAIGRWY